MTKIVAARFWCCEVCDAHCYEYKNIVTHLKKIHGIDVNSKQANAGTVGDNLVVSDLAVPEDVMEKLCD